MSQAIEILRSLDRKERFAVLREALGFDGNAPVLEPGFRDRLSDCIGVAVPEDGVCRLGLPSRLDRDRAPPRRRSGHRPDKPFESPAADRVNKNQQDVDLLIAFDAAERNGPATHLVLIEAKAYLHWTNGQLEGKTKRLA